MQISKSNVMECFFLSFFFLAFLFLSYEFFICLLGPHVLLRLLVSSTKMFNIMNHLLYMMDNQWWPTLYYTNYSIAETVPLVSFSVRTCRKGRQDAQFKFRDLFQQGTTERSTVKALGWINPNNVLGVKDRSKVFTIYCMLALICLLAVLWGSRT